MLTSVFSIKGAPGTTSTALVLAATWPRDVVLVEADPSGGDLAYRCVTPRGGVLAEAPSLLSLALDVRRQPHRIDVSMHTQVLANGTKLVQGARATQAAGWAAALWSGLASALRASDTDVIVDLGRLSPHSPHLAVARHSDLLVPVASASVESVMHTTTNLAPLLTAVAGAHRQRVRPVLVGDDRTSTSDCADHDALLGRAGVPDVETSSLPLDASALTRLESGERPDGRLGRTLLVRRAHRHTLHWAGRPVGGTPPAAPTVNTSAAPVPTAQPDRGSRWMVPRPGGAA